MNHCAALSLLNDHASSTWLLQLGAGLCAAKLGQRVSENCFQLIPMVQLYSWIRG